MLKAFDLWSATDVVAHQDAILEQLAPGTCPATEHGRPRRCPCCGLDGPGITALTPAGAA